MPIVIFIEEQPAGYLNNEKVFNIPDQGELPPIPFVWDGKEAHAGELGSGAWRGQKGGRSFFVIYTNRATLIWVSERKEWVAFDVIREYPGGFLYGLYQDEKITIHGPWALDLSHAEALISAYHNYQKYFSPITLEDAIKTPPPIYTICKK